MPGGGTMPGCMPGGGMPTMPCSCCREFVNVCCTSTHVCCTSCCSSWLFCCSWFSRRFCWYRLCCICCICICICCDDSSDGGGGGISGISGTNGISGISGGAARPKLCGPTLGSCSSMRTRARGSWQSLRWMTTIPRPLPRPSKRGRGGPAPPPLRGAGSDLVTAALAAAAFLASRRARFSSSVS